MITELNRLLASPEFMKLSHKIESKNLMSIVHADQREKVHQFILAWLLNPFSNHGLGTFPLSRFLSLVSSGRNESLTPRFENTIFRYPSVAQVLSGDLNFTHGKIYPNTTDLLQYGENQEFSPNELEGRLDIYAHFKIATNTETFSTQKTKLIIETKLNSPLGKDQLERYAKWLQTQQAGLKIPVLVSKNHPSDTIPDVWTSVTWQEIYTEVILSSLASPELTMTGHSHLHEWIESLESSDAIRSVEVEEFCLNILSEYGSNISELERIVNYTHNEQKNYTLNTLVNADWLRNGDEVTFKTTNDEDVYVHDAENTILTGTIGSNGSVGVQLQGSFYTNIANLIADALGRSTPTNYNELIQITHEGETKTLNEYQISYEEHLRSLMPNPEEKAISETIYPQYKKVFDLLFSVAN